MVHLFKIRQTAKGDNKMKNKFTKAVLPALLATMLVYPKQVNAGYPVLDISNLMETITQSIQDMQNWAQEKMMMMAEMDLQSMLSGLNIDAQNNAMTNLIVRDGLKDQTIQNIEMTMHSVPDMDACGTLTQQIVAKETQKNNALKKQSQIRKEQKKHNDFGKSVKQWKNAQEEVVEDVFEYCKGTGGNDGLKSSLCSQGSLIVGGSSGTTLSGAESDASSQVVDLLVGVNSEYKKSNDVTKDTVEHKKLTLEEMRKEAFRDLARVSLHEVSKQFSSTGNLPSPYQILRQFDNERYGNEQWLKDIQNVDPDNKNAVYISEITRKIAIMNAFMVHMDVIKYKQQLRMEALQGAMLALEVEPL